MLLPKQVAAHLAVLKRAVLHGRVPGQLVIQYTDRCNAQCPQCGMRASNPYQRHSLDPERCRQIIAKAAGQGFAAISFTGGEPFLYLDEICSLSRFAASQGIKYIRTGTNGYLFCGAERAGFLDRIRRLADQLADTPIRNIWVSLDSSDSGVHEQMRGLPGVVRGIEAAVPILAERGLHLSANLGINRNFAGWPPDKELDYGYFYSGFDRFYRFAKSLGFSIANVCYPMWSAPQDQEGAAVYAATSSDQVVYFSRPEKLALFQALFDVIPHHRQQLRIFTPRSSLHALFKQHRGQPQFSSPCLGGEDFFFIDSRDGNCYPCGYRGEETLGSFERLDLGGCRNQAECRRCDWECFRDPSELFSPLLMLRRSPGELLQRWQQDAQFLKLWWEDLRYYRQCDYFNGRSLSQVGR